MYAKPAPPRLRKTKAAAVTAAAMATTATLTFGASTMAAEAVLADRSEVAISVSEQLTQEQIDLLASIGVYPTGPVFQAARLAGLGNPDAMLNALQNLAGLLGQDGLASTIGIIRDLLDAIPLPIDARVPGFGPAGIIDAAAELDGDLATKGLLTVLKTALLNAKNLGSLAPILAGLGIDLPPGVLPYLDLLANLPLNVPGTSAEVESELLNELIAWFIDEFPGLSLGGFVSDADKLAVIPAFGLGGTNFALASPTFLNDPRFAQTAVLALLIRNTSRPGGGIVAMLNPFSQLVGLNLANMDGRGNPQSDTIDIELATVTITEYDGNLTVWDITAAYDLLSDAPSTIYNPLAWANSAVGFVMPTYLIPSTLTQILDGDVLGGLLASLGMLKIDISEHDGNLYITYDSGNLPLLEPVRFLPRTLSYFPGFNISTPISSSFEQALRTLVATGYQDVDITDTDGDGVYAFTRGWDMAGSQAYFWEGPVNFTDGLEVPQTVLNDIVDGLSKRLLNPEDNSLQLFGNDTLTKLLYDNDLAIPVAKFISDGLKQVMATLNPIINDIQEPLKELTRLIDGAVDEVNTLIRNGLKAGAANPIIDLEGPLLDANRFINDLTSPLDNGIPNAIGNFVNDTGSSAELMKSAGPDANAFQLAAGLGNGQDLLADDGKASQAKSIATSLKKQREALRDAADERIAKTRRSLDKRAAEFNAVTDKLAKGNIGGRYRRRARTSRSVSTGSARTSRTVSTS